MKLTEKLIKKGFEIVRIKSNSIIKKETYQKGFVIIDVYSQCSGENWYILKTELRVKTNSKFNTMDKLDDVLELFNNQ